MHPQGQHEYPFTFHLPQNLPTSFEGQYGYVRYSAKANIDRPWKFDHDTKSAFTVICQYDLNANFAASALRVSQRSCIVVVPFGEISFHSLTQRRKDVGKIQDFGWAGRGLMRMTPNGTLKC